MPLSIHHFFSGYGNFLLMPFSGLMPKNLFYDIGGIDKNFEAIFWEIDLAMRVYALGGKVVISDVFLDEDKNKCEFPERDLWDQSGVRDRRLLENLWIDEDKVCLSRKKPVNSFYDTNILKFSQGPRGRWRGKGLVILEKIENNLQSQWSIPGRVFRALCRPQNYFSYAKRVISYLDRNILHRSN